jgi:hypothetical protein
MKLDGNLPRNRARSSFEQPIFQADAVLGAFAEMMWRRLSSLRVWRLSSRQFPRQRNTGLESPVNPPARMSALHQ